MCQSRKAVFMHMDTVCILFSVLLIICLGVCYSSSTQTVSLSPSGEALVCVGDQLTVTCRATNLSERDFITWNITTIVGGRYENEQRLISAAGQGFLMPLTIGDMLTFNFTNESISDPARDLSITFTSNLSVVVTPPLNGTVITCQAQSFVTDNFVQKTAILIVHLLGDEMIDTVIHLSTEDAVTEITDHNITINLSWAQSISVPLLSYSVHVVPHITVNFMNTLSIKLTMSYNVSYTVTIVGRLCRQNVSSVIREFRYVKCHNLQEQFTMDNNRVRVVGSNGPAIEGTIVTLECASLKSSLVYFGPNTTVCNSNGEWEPDPSHAECVGTLLGAGYVPILSSLVTIFGAIFFFIGVTFTVVVLKRRKRSSRDAHMNIEQDKDNSQEDSSEYSVLKHSVPHAKHIKQKGRAHQSQDTLVYADIGLSSIQKKQCVPIANCNDDRVEYSQVNFNAKPTQRRKERHPLDDLLNLDSLMIQIKADVTPKWYQFGEATGMKKAILDKYSQYPPEQCIVEVLDHWLRNHTGSPTWREVAEILRKINMKQLASAIGNVYETGKLPIQMNTDEEFLPELVQVHVTDSESTPPPIPPKTNI